MVAEKRPFAGIAVLVFVLLALMLGLIVQGCGGVSGMGSGVGSSNGSSPGGSGSSGGGSGNGSGGSSGGGGSGSGGVSGASFAYTPGLPSSGPNLAGFQITSGAVRPVSGSPFLAPGSSPSAAAYGNFVFTFTSTQNSNTLLTWRVDPNSGSLKQIASTNPANAARLATGGPGKFLYTVSSAVSVYAIDPNTGNLTQIPGSPFTVTDLSGPSMISPDGKWICGPAFAGPGASQLECDQLDPSTGAVVTPQGQAIRGTQNFLVLGFSTDDLLIAGGGQSDSPQSFQVLQITPSGFQVLSSVPAQMPAGGAISPDNMFVVGVDAGTQQVNVYRFGETKGSLRLLSQTTVPDRSPGAAAFTPQGKNVAIAFVVGNALGVYNISPSGSLTAVTGSPIPTVPSPVSVVVPDPH
jgi:hypothetical protein